MLGDRRDNGAEKKMATEDHIAVEGRGDDEEDLRRRTWLPWLVLLVVLAIIAWFIWMYSDFGKAPDQQDLVKVRVRTARVPDVVGMTKRDAIRALEAAGFRVEVEVSYDVVATAGTVVSQNPSAGSRSAAGSTVFISVAVSLDARRAETGVDDEVLRVPNVVGLTEADAVKRVEGRGLRPLVTRMHSDSVAQGEVFSQTPRAGTAADPGDTVGILVSAGQRAAATVRVPDLVGLSQKEAESRILKAGLEPRPLYQPKTDSIGRVYQQSPDSGERVPRGRYVFILIGARP